MKMIALMSLLTTGLGCAADTEMSFDLPPVSVGKADGTHATIMWNEAGTRGTVSGSFANTESTPVVVGLSVPGAAGLATIAVRLSSGTTHLFVRNPDGSVLMQAHGEDGGVLSEFEHHAGTEYELNLYVVGASSGTYTIAVESAGACANNDQWEPNDTLGSAPEVGYSRLLRAGICGDDIDSFSMTAPYSTLRALLLDPTGGDAGLTIHVDDCSGPECQGTPRGDGVSELVVEPLLVPTYLVVTATRNTDYQISLCIEDRLETRSSGNDNDTPERASPLSERHLGDAQLFNLCSYSLRQNEEAGGRVVAEWRDIDYYMLEAPAFSVITVRLASETFIEDSRYEHLQLVAPESARETEPGVWQFVATSDNPIFAVTNIDPDGAVVNAHSTYTMAVSTDAGEEE